MLAISEAPEKKAGLAYWANRVLLECDNAALGFAADPVHDLRVAIRRCRSMADGFLSVDPDPAWKQMKRLGKPLFAALGELRDTQVMLEWVAQLAPPGDGAAEVLTAALTAKEIEQKAAAQQALVAFDRKRWQSLNVHLARRTGRVPLEGTVFQQVALERWMDARELHRRALRNRSGAAYHQLRIGIKRFRYTVENFLPERHAKWGKDLRILQDALGEVHDFDVLRALLKGADVPAAERDVWYGRIRGERQARIDLYRAKMVGAHSLWQVWRAELPCGDALKQAGLDKLRTWAEFLDPDIPHTRAVTQIALRLYDDVLQCGTTHKSPEGRWLLEAAAVLHEVGRGKSANGHGGHQKRGRRIVDKLKPPLEWTAEQMRCIAAMVRFHRGKLPSDRDPAFAGLSAKRRSELMSLIGVLRLANAFDEEHDERISRLHVERQEGSVTIYAEGLQPMSRAAERIARARYVLEAACGIGIMVRPMPPSARQAIPPAAEATPARRA